MATETSVLAGVEPAPFWGHFETLTRIPRPSRQEEPVIEHVREWAAAHGFEFQQDAGRNVVVRVPATPGRESAPTLTLQGHLDMVCERDPASANDPAEGRIELVRDGDWLKADGTTLGADDGVAIAAMMALVEDESLPHGPLELLMTVAEEVGLEGANALDAALVTGSILVNLDSEEDGRLTVGCAGSTDTWIRITSPREEAADRVSLAVTVSGGKGGHSGSGIALGHSNAVKVLGRALREANETVPFQLVSFAGGKSRNAIPRDAAAVCAVPAGREQDFRDAVAAANETIRDAYAKTDAGVSVSVDAADGAEPGWSEDATARLLDVVALVPTGPLAMSPDFPGLVETSSSVGVAGTAGGTLTLRCLSRSQDDDALPVVRAQIEAAARLAGATHESLGSYPAWRPDPDALLLATATRVHAGLFGAEPEVSATHGGLETALIGAKRPGLPMLSFGPEIQGPHAPCERLHIASAGRFMQLLRALLDELSR